MTKHTGQGEMGRMMQACMRKCRWCPLIPVLLGVVLFLLGYFLEAEVVQILWLFFSGLIVFFGLIALIIMNLMIGRNRHNNPE